MITALMDAALAAETPSLLAWWTRAPAKSGQAEQGERVVEAVAGPAQAFGDVGMASSAKHGDGEVTERGAHAMLVRHRCKPAPGPA